MKTALLALLAIIPAAGQGTELYPLRIDFTRVTYRRHLIAPTDEGGKGIAVSNGKTMRFHYSGRGCGPSTTGHVPGRIYSMNADGTAKLAVLLVDAQNGTRHECVIEIHKDPA